MTLHGEITQTLRPSSANYWKGTAFSAVFLVPLILFQLFVNRDRPGLWITLVIVVPICLAVIAVYFARARLFLTASHIGKQGILGTRWIAKADIDRALLVRNYTAPMEQPRTELFAFARDGRKLLRLFGRFWAEADMITLITASGATQGLLEGPVTPKQVTAIEPKALGWVEAHPWLSAFVLTFGLIIAIIVIVIAVLALT